MRIGALPPAVILAAILSGCAAPPADIAAPAPFAEPRPAAPGPPISPRPTLALRIPAGGACRLEPVAVLPLLPTGGDKPEVAIRIDDIPLRMAVDTGAETSVLSPRTAAVLGLQEAATRTDVQGLAGAADYGSVRVDRIDLGPAAVGGRTLPVMRLGAQADPPAGLIGADLLGAYQVMFDFPAHRLTLYQAYGCADFTPGGGTWTRLRWRVAAHDLPLVGATLDGRRLIALLDTGTASSAVAAGRVPLGPTAGRSDPLVTGYAAGGGALHGSLHRFDRLDVGGIGVDRPALRVVPMPGLPIDLLIGMDVLRGRRLWLDYPHRWAFLQSE